MIPLRLPSLPEVEHLAETLEAGGYAPAEAAAQYRNAFCRDPADVDGCLMFEGPNIRAVEDMADAWGNLTDDERESWRSSWLNEVTFCALLTLAAKAGHPEALATRDKSLAYCRTNWT